MAGVITSDVDSFISSIEKRPGLYLKSLQEYSDTIKTNKRKLWEEVCLEVVFGWAGLKAEQKSKICLDVQKKWMNLRTCFSRELKIQQRSVPGGPSKKRRTYMYFDKLMFLKPSMTQRSVTENNTESYDGEEKSIHVESNDESIPAPSKPAKRQKKQKTMNAILKQSLLNLFKEDFDEDKNFALSLVPTLRSFTEDEKLTAKIEILQLFQRIKNNRLTDNQGYADSFIRPGECAEGSSWQFRK